MSRRVLEPGPDHPISIDEMPVDVILSVADEAVGHGSAVILTEANYPPVLYIDCKTIDAARLTQSDKTTWCPYKGEATHYHLMLDDGSILENTIWSYEAPLPAVAAIKDRLAFYPAVCVKLA